MNEIRAHHTDLSEVDQRIVSELVRDGKLSNQELAARVGIAPSTCHGRVKHLEERGVIRGYRAVVDPEALGYGVQTLIFLQIQQHQRDLVPEVAEKLKRVRGVRQVFLIGGTMDIVLHVAQASVRDIRNFIAEELGTNPVLSASQTQLVFEHFEGVGPLF